MNIAIYGGTFDPPTLAHEAIMQKALQQNYIDELWVMPSAPRIDKPFMAPIIARLAMLERVKVALGSKKLHISHFEVDMIGPTQTQYTYKALTRSFPDSSFLYIFGADSYADMPNWQDGRVLQQKMGVLLVARQGYVLPSESDTIKHLHVPEVLSLATSSSVVRSAVALGDPICHLVSAPVADYIYKQHLYKAVQ